LKRSLDSSLASVQRLDPKLLAQPVYAYIVTTVKNRGGLLGQTGSAPNFQGGYITLCTCKHKDRASSPPHGRRGTNPADHWQGMWVAGLCSPTEFRPRALFYLMLVKASYDSHASMWKALGTPTLKSAHHDIFGDVYEPLAKHPSAAWTQGSYATHLGTHVHGTADRERDIEESYYGRYPRLLLGDPAQSYLWSAPILRLKKADDAGWKSAHHRFYPDLASFLATLR
jgi:hypothetical protein